jgi:hypothetical protein
MNKVDKLVSQMILKYPNMYPSRFEAFCDLMTNTNFAWNKKGELIEDGDSPFRDATPESMLAKCQGEIDKQIEKASKDWMVDVPHADRQWSFRGT